MITRIFLILFFSFCSAGLFGEETGLQVENAGEGGGTFTFYDVVFGSGMIGILIWGLLFATSTAALAITIRAVWSLRKSRFLTLGFTEQILPLVESKNYQEAYNACVGSPALAKKIVREVLLVAHLKNKTARQELATAILDREVRAVLRQINSISTCSNIAPMLGLLGTVTGMVDAFLGLGTAMGPEKASVLAISISQALYTTAAGLLIAVPAIVLALIFRNLLEKRVEAVTESVEKILDAIP